MGAAENRQLIEKYYEALSAGDFELLASLHTDDVVFNLVGNTPVSGRFVGKDICFGEVVAQVVGSLQPETIKFGVKWRIMAVDDKCVVGLMQGGGMGVNGEEYAQTYCQVFSIREGKIFELHEFFDTVMVEKTLFSNHLQKPETVPTNPFQF